MDRLAFVILHSPQLDVMKRFYRDQIGLAVRLDSPHWVEFDTAGATLALHDTPDLGRTGIELGFVVPDVDDRMRRLQSRSVPIERGVERDAAGAMIAIRDPDGVRIAMMTPSAPYRDGDGMQLSTAMIHCLDLHAAKAYYRNVLGMRVTRDSAWWVEFDTGAAHIALRPRGEALAVESSAGGSLAFSLSIDDLMTWADERRTRGLSFAIGPHDTNFGVMANIVDPDGNVVVLHEPGDEAESALADAADAEALPVRSAVRKPNGLRVKAVSRVALKPAYKPSVKGRKSRTQRPVASAGAGVASAGAGVASAGGVRKKPKRVAADLKVARPALGRRKKAERKMFGEQTRAKATASRAKPVKKTAVRKAKPRTAAVRVRSGKATAKTARRGGSAKR